MKIQAKSKLLFIGDSITDVGRARPVGERAKGGLGTGYVNLVDAMIGSKYPDRHIRTMNVGTSGNTVRDLRSRWQTDVIDLKPDWLSIMIGINDVWRQFDRPDQTDNPVLLDEYRSVLDALIVQTSPSLKGLILMTPYFIQPLKTDAMRSKMDEYGAAVKSLADSRGAIFVDVQAAFDSHLAHCHPTALAWDQVHPDTLGHMIIARAFLNAINF